MAEPVKVEIETPVPVQFAYGLSGSERIGRGVGRLLGLLVLSPWIVMLGLGTLHDVVPIVPALSYAHTFVLRLTVVNLLPQLDSWHELFLKPTKG